ncbi:MAG: hypothetical protein AAB613_02405 [Patescibacteria group bacterium]
MLEGQGILLMSTPPAVERARKNLAQASSRKSAAASELNKLKAQVESTESKLQIKMEDVGVLERLFVLICCQELERLLANEGKGWCPICERLVNFDGYGVAYSTISRHCDAHEGDHGYMGGTSAADWTEYVYWRVPHRIHQLCEKKFERVPRYPLSHSYGGTIADAPAEVFTAFGILALDTEMLKRAKLSPWDFVDKNRSR